MKLTDHGRDNEIIGLHDHLEGSVTFIGDGNKIILGDNIVARYVHLEVFHGSVVSIGSGVHLGVFNSYLHRRGELRVSEGCGFGSSEIMLHEPSRVVFGAGCLVSNGVKITTSDMHAIYDIATGARVNLPADVVVGHHVWLSENVRLHGGTHIGANSIIEAESLVAGYIPNNSMAAGRPARVVREGVRWTFELPED